MNKTGRLSPSTLALFDTLCEMAVEQRLSSLKFRQHFLFRHSDIAPLPAESFQGAGNRLRVQSSQPPDFGLRRRLRQA